MAAFPENRVGPKALLGEQRAAARSVTAMCSVCCTTETLPGRPTASFGLSREER
jgi:hypothetical protein